MSKSKLLLFGACVWLCFGCSELCAWSFLKSGDKISLVAPSSLVSSELLDKVKENIEDYGFKPEYSKNMNQPESGAYGSLDPTFRNRYSNSDGVRVQTFQDALLSDSKAIWALRGGCSCEHLLAAIDKGEISFPSNLKPIIGFSDITALHLYYAKRGWVSLHAPVAALSKQTQIVKESVVNSEADMDEVLDVLSGKTRSLAYNLSPVNNYATPSTPTVIEGSIIGGAVVILCTHIGTPTRWTRQGNLFSLRHPEPSPPGQRFMSATLCTSCAVGLSKVRKELS